MVFTRGGMNDSGMLAPDRIPTADLIEVRRRLHRAPELSMVEHETAAFVAERLRAQGLDSVREGVGKTGVLGILKGGKPGPVTAACAPTWTRLPIAELVDADYRSRASGRDARVRARRSRQHPARRGRDAGAGAARRYRARSSSASNRAKKATRATG